jgi:hypothetical protein
VGGKTSWFAALGVRVVLVLGVAYVSLWWSYQQFYSVFGVAPEDVGFTPSGGLGDIIGAVLRLGLWLSVALIVLGLLPVAVVGAVMYAIERKRDTRGGPHGPIADLKSAREWLRGETVKSTDEAPSEPRILWKSRIAVWAGTFVGVAFLGALVLAYGALIGWIYAGVVIALIVMITAGEVSELRSRSRRRTESNRRGSRFAGGRRANGGCFAQATSSSWSRSSACSSSTSRATRTR